MLNEIAATWCILSFMTSTDRIAKNILEVRRELIREWLNGPQGEELVRLERAYVNLTGLPAPSISDVAREIKRGRTLTNAEKRSGIVRRPAKNRRSVKDAVREYVEASSRKFSIGTVVKHLEGLDEDFKVSDLRASVRSALYHLEQNGLIIKIQPGIYRPAHQPSGGDLDE
jgi:hypothetical protein